MIRASLSPRQSRQRGAALFIGLIFLLLITMIGVIAIQTSTLEERMAGNARDINVATQAAEMALRAGETQINARTEQTPTTGYYNVEATAAPDAADYSQWTSANAKSLTTITFTSMKVNSTPLFWIEKQPNTALANKSMETVQTMTIEPFYVSAYSTGGSGTANVVLQSAYRRLISN